MAEVAETVGQRLKRLRLERGLSQRELGCPGVSYAYISRIEAGVRQPSVKALRKLARRLEVGVGYLETGSDIDEQAERELRVADAELALRLGDRSVAAAQLEAVAEEARAAADWQVTSRALLALALAADEDGNHALAVARFTRAFELERPSPLLRLDVYATLGRAYGALGRVADEIALYEACIAEAEQLAKGSPSVQTRYRILLSYALSDAGDLSRAEETLDVALREAASDEDPYMRIRVYWSLARLAEMEGRSATALRHARQAIALLEQTEDTLHRARARLLAAWIMNSAGDAAGARGQLELAEALFGDSVGADDRARLNVERSRVEAALGNGGDAVRLAEAAIDGLGEQHEPILGTALCALGHGLAIGGDVDAAADAFTRGLDLLSEMRRWREACDAARLYGRLLQQAGREKDAVAAMQRAADFALRLSTPVALDR